MAFTQFMLDRAFVQTRDIFDIYVYRTEDDVATVQGAEYFAEARFADSDPESWFNGRILCDCSDGYFEAFIDTSGTVIPSPPAGVVTSVNGQTGDVTGLEEQANKGQINGYAGLDGAGTVPLAQLPAAVIGDASYLGLWDASTNTPALADGTGDNGNFYRVSVAGSTDFGNGSISFEVGQSVIYSGALNLWQKIGIEATEYMLKATYDPNNVNGDAFDMDNMVEGATNKILTQSERDNISANTADRHVAVTLDAGDTTQETIDLTGQELTVNLASPTTDGAMSGTDKARLDNFSLQDAYDGGQSIATSSGAMSLDNTGETTAPFQIVPNPTAPTTGLGGGQIFVDTDGTPYSYDSTRSKWLSISQNIFLFADNGVTDGEFLRVGFSNTTNIGWVAPYDGTIFAIEAISSAGNDAKGFEVQLNTVVEETFNLASFQYEDLSADIDFSAGDIIQVFCPAAGAQTNSPIVQLHTKWRK